MGLGSMPKFLNTDDAGVCVRECVEFVFGKNITKGKDLHVVVLVPSVKFAEDYPDHEVIPKVLVEVSFFGQKDEWKHDYADIARCKASQIWDGRSDGSQIQPHLLVQSEVPFFGGVKREGIVVACSGVEPYFDRMISGMIADMLIGLARHAWETSNDKKNGVDNLT